MSRRAAAVLAERRTQEELAAEPEAGDEGEEQDASFELTDADAQKQGKKGARKGPALLGKRGAAGGIALSDDEDEDEEPAAVASSAEATTASREGSGTKVSDGAIANDDVSAEADDATTQAMKGKETSKGKEDKADKSSSLSSSASKSMGALLAEMNRPRKKKKRKTGKMDKSLARLLKDSDEASADKKKAASEAARAALAIAGKMKIEEQKHFAGQTISVVRSVAKSSAEAQQAAAKASEAAKQSELDKIVSELKNPKKSMSAVEKSSHDWDQFKEEKGIGDQLEAYAKDGYVEKQQFLQRVEERQFEAGRAERERARAMADAAAAAAKKR